MKNGLIIDCYGTSIYYKDDKIHRENGPAYISKFPRTEIYTTFWVLNRG
jgi:hypothetical protein